MYLLKRLSFTPVDLTTYCKDRDLEACAIKLKLSQIFVFSLFIDHQLVISSS
jgi:hypothetical protein